MNRNASGEHTFIIRNDGDAQLIIGKGKATCKCTEFELAKDKLAPGETTEVHLKWKTQTTELQFEQSAPLIVENAPDKPTVSLTIEGRVIDVVRPERWELVLTDISANEAAHSRLKIFAYKGDKLAIDKHEWVNPRRPGISRSGSSRSRPRSWPPSREQPPAWRCCSRSIGGCRWGRSTKRSA